MDLNDNGECIIEISKQLLIVNTELPLLSLVEFMYPQFVVNMMEQSCAQQMIL